MPFFGEEDRKCRNELVNVPGLLMALAVHAVIFLLVLISGCHTSAKETIIPIDMTVVPPWAEQTDDPDPDPNPPPPEEKPRPKPKPDPKPAPETPKEDDRKVDAVQKVVEKKPKKDKPKKKEKPNLKDKAKFVKSAPKAADLRSKAKKVEAPPTKRYGKGTAADKPLSPEEFARRMNEGYRIGSRNQIATSEEQRCASIIKAAIAREWSKDSFMWHSDLVPLTVEISFGRGGRVTDFRILRGSGDATVDATARSALGRLRSIPGLSSSFIEQYPRLVVTMEPTSGT